MRLLKRKKKDLTCKSERRNSVDEMFLLIFYIHFSSPRPSFFFIFGTTASFILTKKAFVSLNTR